MSRLGDLESITLVSYHHSPIPKERGLLLLAKAVHPS